MKSDRARLTELAEILALGLMRGTERKSSPKSSELGEVSLDISGHRSGQPTCPAGRTLDLKLCFRIRSTTRR